MRFITVILFLLFPFSSALVSQEIFPDGKKPQFTACKNQKGGFDATSYPKDKLPFTDDPDSLYYSFGVKSIPTNQQDTILFIHWGKTYSFHSNQPTESIQVDSITPFTSRILLPAYDQPWSIRVLDDKNYLGSLTIIPYSPISKTIQLLVPSSYVMDSLMDLNTVIHPVFKGANLHLKIQLSTFQSSVIPKNLLDSLEFPEDESERTYSAEMSFLTRYFQGDSLYDFRFIAIHQFDDTLKKSYMPIGQKWGFIVTESDWSKEIIELLSRGLGFQRNYDGQLEFPDSLVLSFLDWENLRLDSEARIVWKERQKTTSSGAVTAYYFWEENENGEIMEESYSKPYRRNYFVLPIKQAQPNKDLAIPQVRYAVENVTHNNQGTSKTHFEYTKNNMHYKYSFALQRYPSNDWSSVIYRKKNKQWECLKRESVLYFNVFNDSIRTYSHANDSLILLKYNVALPGNGHFVVKTHWNQFGKISKQEVFAYNGENVTSYFSQPERIVPKRVLVFSNGYRGPTKNSDVSDHLVTHKDRYHYWMKIDKKFIERLQPFDTYYIDGSHDIQTSSHKTMTNFGLSIALAKTIAAKDNYSILNTERNVDGFNERREKGRIAGKAFLAERCQSPACEDTRDTVDIVCHSMGYAYVLGFIDAIKDRVVFGKMYILAPENACVGGADWSLFEEVWQYGSNLDQQNPDPVWEQDGIAPQCQVAGLETLPKGKGGRAFIPSDWPHKNFIDSHMLNYFHWIFDRIQEGENGFVKK